MSQYFRARRAPRHVRGPVQFRPQLEMLETRTMPDTGLSALTSNLAASAADHVLVQFETGFAPNGLLPAGASLGEQLPLLPNLYTVNLPAGWSVSQMLAGLQNNPHVRFAQPDYQVSAAATPNDPGFSSQWGLSNSAVPGADIHAPAAWNVSTGSGGTIVAVIDTGVDYNHPDLAANMWTNAGEIPGNGIDDDHDGFVDDVHGVNFINNTGDPMDDNSHGTHVAGIIGAVGNNGVGVAGVAWHVQIMALKFLDTSGSGSTSNAIRALNFAVAHGATISNNSWGGGGFNQALSDAINSARTSGHIFVAAAGNSGANNDTTPFYPASYNLANVVAVAASDSNDQLAGFSNYGGTTVDLAAPGTNIYSTIPVSMGSYGYKSGTSMATPFVTGALAMVRDMHPTWSYSQVINQVLNNVDPLSSLSGKVISGGRLNLANALGSAISPPSLSIGNASVTEGNSGSTSAVFTVTLSTPSSSTTSVAWATADGSATTADGDYGGASGTLAFAPGETSKTISVTVYGDTNVELDENFFVNLSNASGATISSGQGTGTILNDDSTTTISVAINDVAVIEGNSGVAYAVFTVSLSSASASAVSVNYTTADGTAAAASGEYVSGSGTLTFAPGETSKTISVAVQGDTVVEPDETFFVNLSNPSNAALADNQGLGTIRNDDTTISINNVSVLEGNSGTTLVTMSLTLSQASALTVTVKYATANGTASSKSDYFAASGTVTFNPGETSKTITLKIKGDKTREMDEYFFVNLSAAKNASLAIGQGIVTILNDDGVTPTATTTTAFEYDAVHRKWKRISPRSHSPAAAYWSSLAAASNGSGFVLPGGASVWVNNLGKDLRSAGTPTSDGEKTT